VTEICKVCGVEITGRVGDYMGWTLRGCPFDDDQPVDEYPCEPIPALKATAPHPKARR
jgi:hypothetical protein